MSGIDEDQLAKYMAQIKQRFPTLVVASVRVDAEALTNNVLIINHELVFRFPKSDWAAQLLSYECRLLRYIQPLLPAPVPMVEYCGRDFMMYRYLPGAPLYLHLLKKAPRPVQERLASALAGFLNQLHSLSLKRLPHRPGPAALAAVNRQEHALKMLAEVERELFPLFWADQRAWVQQLFAPLRAGSLNLDTYQPALIHDDLASYHILVDWQPGNLAGVIDWGMAAAGDPAKDIAALINTYGESLLRQMMVDYPLDDATLDRARFYAGAIELEWALNGVRSRDQGWFLVHIGRARDSRPFGEG